MTRNRFGSDPAALQQLRDIVAAVHRTIACRQTRDRNVIGFGGRAWRLRSAVLALWS
jgi:hypothetical protein